MKDKVMIVIYLDMTGYVQDKSTICYYIYIFFFFFQDSLFHSVTLSLNFRFVWKYTTVLSKLYPFSSISLDFLKLYKYKIGNINNVLYCIWVISKDFLFMFENLSKNLRYLILYYFYFWTWDFLLYSFHIQMSSAINI